MVKFKNAVAKPVYILSLFGLVVTFSFASFAREFSVSNDLLPAAESAGGASLWSAFLKSEKPQIFEKINQGVALLEASAPLSMANGRQVAVAVWNTSTGDVFEKRLWIREERGGGARFEPVNPSEKLDIQPRWWNGYNTFYEITDHPEMVVVANKYPVQSSYLGTLPERSAGKYTDIIYVPYSKAIHTPEVVAAGKAYMNHIIEEGFSQLRKDKVPAFSEPGTLVAEVIPTDLIKTIMLVEHVDPDGFRLAADGGQELTERVLTIVGANQGRAYRYSTSPAGAAGIAQFIRPTYDTMVASYPSANLIRNHQLGMANHVNAVKAMALFFDIHTRDIEDSVTRTDVLSRIGVTEEMLAAAYNGGPGRVIKSVDKYGAMWAAVQDTLPQKKKSFRDETLTYIKKFGAIKNLVSF